MSRRRAIVICVLAANLGYAIGFFAGGTFGSRVMVPIWMSKTSNDARIAMWLSMYVFGGSIIGAAMALALALLYCRPRLKRTRVEM
jgi:hypothetical protein